HGADGAPHPVLQAAVGIVHVVLPFLLRQAHPGLAPRQAQEALVLAVVHILPAPEQGELILIGPGIVGAEHGAVAALVAHAVHVDDLAHLQAGHRHRHVGPVGAHAGASLAYRSAAQAAAFLAGLAIGADVAP